MVMFVIRGARGAKREGGIGCHGDCGVSVGLLARRACVTWQQVWRRAARAREVQVHSKYSAVSV